MLLFEKFRTYDIDDRKIVDLTDVQRRIKKEEIGVLLTEVLRLRDAGAEFRLNKETNLYDCIVCAVPSP